MTYRHPGLLAKIVTTLDVLSEGRAFMGIGAAWYEREHLALGVQYPPIKRALRATRGGAPDRAADVERRRGTFDGQALPAEGDHLRSRVDHQPHPPIVIGGSGEKKTLRLVAQYADACNLIAPDAATIKHKLDVLRGHCDDLGRDYDSIEKTVMGPQVDPLADPDGFLRTMESYAALGVEHVHLRAPNPDPVGAIHAFGEKIAPRLTQLV